MSSQDGPYIQMSSQDDDDDYVFAQYVVRFNPIENFYDQKLIPVQYNPHHDIKDLEQIVQYNREIMENSIKIEQRSKLYKAISDCNFNEIMRLLDFVDPSNTDLLTMACHWGKDYIVKKALTFPNILMPKIGHICASENVECIRLILEDPRSVITDGDYYIINNFVIRNSSMEVLKVIKDTKGIEKFGRLFLITAIYWERVDVVKYLLENGVDASDLDSENLEINELLAQWRYHPRVFG